MPLVPAKCPECGGLVEVNNEKRAGICQHCGEAFTIEDAIQTFNTYYQTTNNYNTTHNYGDGAVVNIYEDKSKDFEIVGGVLKKYKGESIDVVIPDNVMSIDKSAFIDALNVRNITIPGSVEKMSLCPLPKLENLCYLGDLQDWIVLWGECNYQGENLIHFYIGNQLVNNDSIMKISGDIIPNYSFSNCCDISGNVVLPSQILKVGDGAFRRCKNIKSVDMNNVVSIGISAFYNCSNLTNVRINNKLEFIAYDFIEGTLVQDVLLYNYVPYHYSVGHRDERFHIKEINLKDYPKQMTFWESVIDNFIIPDNYSFEKYGKDGGFFFLFYRCKIKNLVIGDNVTMYGHNIETVNSDAYSSGTVIYNLYVGKNLKTIGGRRFSALGSVKVDSSVNSFTSNGRVCPICGGKLNLFGKCKKCERNIH